MITISNYLEQSKGINFAQLGQGFADAHAYIMRATMNCTNWSAYDSPSIKKTIDGYLKKLNEALDAQNTNAKKLIDRPQPLIPKSKNNAEKKSKTVLLPNNAGHKNTGITDKYADAVYEEEEEDEIEMVERIPDELKFLRRYVNLNEKRKSREDVLRFINALQRAIVAKIIRAASPFAKQIRFIQDDLVKRYNTMSRPEVIHITQRVLTEFREIIGSQKVMPSVNLIRRYINLNGKFGVKEKAAGLIKAMENAHAKGRVLKKDKYYKIFDRMHRSLSAFVNNRSQRTLNIEKAELSGLNGILVEHGGSYAPKRSGQQLAGIDDARIMTLADARNAKFDPIGLSGDFLTLIGNACAPMHVLAYGEGGSGKSSFLLKLAAYLNSLGYKILYVAGEQYNTPTFTNLLSRLNIYGNRDFVIVKDLDTLNPEDFDYVALDSKDSLDIDVDDFRAMKAMYPAQSFLISSQGTKTGDFTGSGQWRNEVDTMVFCEDGIAKTGVDKNRWGGKSEYNIYSSGHYRQAA